jgi:hypothetical protein
MHNAFYFSLVQLQDPHHSWWYQPSAEEEHSIQRVMLWTEFQAYCSAYSQIGVSACGATSLLNVLVSCWLYVKRVCLIIINIHLRDSLNGKLILSKSTSASG